MKNRLSSLVRIQCFLTRLVSCQVPSPWSKISQASSKHVSLLISSLHIDLSTQITKVSSAFIALYEYKNHNKNVKIGLVRFGHLQVASSSKTKHNLWKFEDCFFISSTLSSNCSKDCLASCNFEIVSPSC